VVHDIEHKDAGGERPKPGGGAAPQQGSTPAQ
jgi:hypothetical protein